MQERVSLGRPWIHQVDKSVDLLAERQLSKWLPGELGDKVKEMTDYFQHLNE